MTTLTKPTKLLRIADLPIMVRRDELQLGRGEPIADTAGAVWDQAANRLPTSRRRSMPSSPATGRCDVRIVVAVAVEAARTVGS